MAWWSFGRKRRKSKKSELPVESTVLDEKRATTVSSVRSPRLSRAASPQSPNPFADQYPFGAVPYELQPAGPPPVLSSSPIPQRVASQPPIHSTTTADPVALPPPQKSPSPPRTPLQSPPKSPEPPLTSTAGRKSSAEDITALPSSRGKLERNSVLGTLPESDANIIAGSANDPALVKRKSTKRRKDDQLREDQVRQLTEPIPIPKRSGRESPQVFRRDSKRIRNDLSQPHQDTSSAVSLPAPRPGSNRSSMTGLTASHRFDVGIMDMLSPRPTLRYSLHGQYTSSAMRAMAPSRADSKTAATSVSRREVKDGRKTIDDLADTMDTGNLRELMERDQRRRERKRKTEEERARRRLDRLAARGEMESQDKRRVREQREAGRRDIQTSPVSVAGPSGIVRTYPSEVHPALRESQIEVAQRGIVETVRDPFEDPADPVENLPPDVPADPIENLSPDVHKPGGEDGPFADPPEAHTEDVRDLEETGLPLEASEQHERDLSNAPQTTDLQSQDLQGIAETPDTDEKDSEPSGRRMGGLAALFRRSIGRGSLTDKGREDPSEGSFSNASRESMSKQSSSQAYEQTFQRRSSGVPVRTRSKFREDLPESPSAAEDSREQSPEVAEAEIEPALLGAAVVSGGAAEAAESGVESQDRGTQPSAALLSESLASVDSEGSWLSGRPRKRTSQQLSIPKPTLTTRRSISAMTTSTAMSKEEYFTPTEEFSPAMTPGGFFNAPELQPGMGGGSQVDTDDGEAADEVMQGGAERTPALVQSEPRIQSSEGLLTQYDDDNHEIDSASEFSDGADEDTIIEEAVIEEATTGSPVVIARQASHARQISAGSARLLDIPAKRESTNLTQFEEGSE